MTENPSAPTGDTSASDVLSSASDVLSSASDAPTEAADQPANVDPASDEPIALIPYQRIVVNRWQVVEGRLREVTTGLHNATIDLARLTSRGDFNEFNLGMTHAFLEAVHGLHQIMSGLVAVPVEEEIREEREEERRRAASKIEVVKSDIVIARA